MIFWKGQQLSFRWRNIMRQDFFMVALSHVRPARIKVRGKRR